MWSSTRTRSRHWVARLRQLDPDSTSWKVVSSFDAHSLLWGRASARLALCVGFAGVSEKSTHSASLRSDPKVGWTLSRFGASPTGPSVPHSVRYFVLRW